MAQRAIWSGTVGFGLVAVPVRMYTAVSEKSVKFNQLNSKTGNRISQKRVDAGTGDEVAYEDIVKGYEVGKDQYVVIAPEELEALAPHMVKTVDIQKFVPLSQIDPILYDKSYFIGPAEGVDKPFALLYQAMLSADVVALGKVILRGGSKQKLMAIRATDEGLVGSLLVFGDELNSAPEIEDVELAERELAMAQTLVASLTEDFDPNEFGDEYREQVLNLIEAKVMGEEYTAPEPEQVAAPDDMMAALEASLAVTQAKVTEAAVKPKATRKPKAKATKKVEA